MRVIRLNNLIYNDNASFNDILVRMNGFKENFLF